MPLRAPQVYPGDQRSFDQWTRSVVITPDPDTVETITIKDKQVTNDKLRDSEPDSVIGRSHGTSGTPGDIAAASDDTFLARRAGSLIFAPLVDADIPATIARDSEVTAAVNAAIAAAVGSGTYTPVFTNVTNLDSSFANLCAYTQVGTIVTVSGRVDLDPTAAGDVELGISLPVASDFTNNMQCAGVAFCNSVAGFGAAILSDATNNRASLRFVAVDTSNRLMMFVFQYQVL